MKSEIFVRRRLATLCLTLFVAIGLVACAVTPQERAKSAPGAVAVASGEGLIAVKITSNRATNSFFFMKWATLTVRDISTGKSFALTDRSDVFASHSLFVQSLPAGTYEIVSVGNMASAMMTITEGAGAEGAFPPFRIADGQMTNLGALVYIRPHSPADSRLFRWGQVESAFDSESILRQLEPSLSAKLETRPTLGWNQGTQLRTRQAVFDATRTATMRALSPVLLDDGTLLMGESFGQIARRSPVGVWDWISSQALLPVRSIYVGGPNALFAGHDDGLLLYGTLQGDVWQPLPLPEGDASVLHIGQSPQNAAEWIVVLQTRDAFLGLTTPKVNPGLWTERFRRARTMYTQPGLDATGAVLSGFGKWILATGSEQAPVEVTTYDRATQEWKSVALKESTGTVRWVMLPDGNLGRFAGIPLTGIYFAVSMDNGVTWERRGELNWVLSAPVFVTPTKGFALRTEGNPVTSSAAPWLWRTEDGGRKWISVGRAPGIGGRLISLGGETLGYAGMDGRFYVSTNGGIDWKMERVAP